MIIDKPIYTGFSVLELRLMYEFYYNILRPYGQDKVHLHYMDSNSFVLSLDTNAVGLVEFQNQIKMYLTLVN